MSDIDSSLGKYEERAEDRYDIDYFGVILNGIISTITSAIAGLGVKITTNVSMELAMIVMLVSFLPQFLVKVVVELEKQRVNKKAQEKAYIMGRRDQKWKDESPDSSNILHTVLTYLDRATLSYSFISLFLTMKR